MQEDKYEQIREQLRKSAVEYDKRIEQKEEQMLKNVMSLAEHFDKSFLNRAKKIKYGKHTLHSIFKNNSTLNNIPIYGELQNNISSTNTKDDLFKIIQNHNANDYKDIVEFKSTTTSTLTYHNVFMFEFSCRCFVNITRAKFVRYSFSPRHLFIDNTYLDTQNFINLEFPSKRLPQSHIDLIDQTQIIPTSIKKTCNKNFSQLYSKIKRMVLKQLETAVKNKFKGLNYCFRCLEFDKISLKRILIPFYTIHCKKPGFDIRYTINANNKEIV